MGDGGGEVFWGDDEALYRFPNPQIPVSRIKGFEFPERERRLGLFGVFRVFRFLGFWVHRVQGFWVYRAQRLRELRFCRYGLLGIMGEVEGFWG